MERRLIEEYALRRRNEELVDEDGDPYDYFILGAGTEILLRYLIRDGYLKRLAPEVPKIGEMSLVEVYQFTQSGTEFVDTWAAAQPLEPPFDDEEYDD